MLLGWHEEHLPPHSLGFVYLPALIGIAVTSMFSHASAPAWRTSCRHAC